MRTEVIRNKEYATNMSGMLMQNGSNTEAPIFPASPAYEASATLSPDIPDRNAAKSDTSVMQRSYSMPISSQIEFERQQNILTTVYNLDSSGEQLVAANENSGKDRKGLHTEEDHQQAKDDSEQSPQPWWAYGWPSTNDITRVPTLPFLQSKHTRQPLSNYAIEEDATSSLDALRNLLLEPYDDLSNTGQNDASLKMDKAASRTRSGMHTQLSEGREPLLQAGCPTDPDHTKKQSSPKDNQGLSQHAMTLAAANHKNHLTRSSCDPIPEAGMPHDAMSFSLAIHPHHLQAKQSN